MTDEKQSESGSIMLEIMAVLAILAIITPVLYKQALLRNIEISNINIAAEMRLVKDQLQEYIANTCPSEYQVCTLSVSDSVTYAPDGMESVIDNYAVLFCDYEYGKDASSTDVNCGESLESKINTAPKRRYALIIDDNPPEMKWNLARAKRVASLVGTEAGVCRSTMSDVTGVNASWSIPNDGYCTSEKPFVIVHTGLNIWN